jgi:uncharacterized OB-fold protein
MKCTNCGFANNSERSVCEKCNTPLVQKKSVSSEQEEISRDVISKTIVGQDAQAHAEGQKISKTLLGEQAREKFIDRPWENDIPKRENGGELSEKECPQCKYRLIPGSPLCPQCNYDLSLNQNNMPKNESPKFSGTIDPYSRKSFTLRPIVNGEAAKEVKEYDGGSVVLNRENTLKDNMTITSKEQAEIVLENGEWYIIDKSEKQTTFVRPGSLTKLNKGDIILLGDTKFIFE